MLTRLDHPEVEEDGTTSVRYLTHVEGDNDIMFLAFNDGSIGLLTEDVNIIAPEQMRDMQQALRECGFGG